MHIILWSPSLCRNIHVVTWSVQEYSCTVLCSPRSVEEYACRARTLGSMCMLMHELSGWVFKGVVGVKSSFFKIYIFFMCSCVYMHLEQDSQVLEQLKMSISRYTYFYIMYLCHSINFTLPRGDSSPPLVHLEEMIPTSQYLTSQYLYIISKCSSFQALFKLFSSSLPYQLKIFIKTRESGVCPATREPKEILLCLERSLEADIPRK